MQKKYLKKKIKIYQKNIQYKTITIILGNNEYQITSFRKDLITFGRQAYVSSADSLHQDSLRRDFTVNALYLNEKGNLMFPLNIDEISETSAEVVADGPAPSPCIVVCPTGLPSITTAFNTPSILAI